MRPTTDNKSVDADVQARMIFEYKTTHVERYICVYDPTAGSVQQMPWVYNYNLIHGRTKNELAGHFAYLSFSQYAYCEVIVPVGQLVKCWAQNESKRIYVYEISSAQCEYGPEIGLPLPNKNSSSPSQPHVLYDYLLDKEQGFVRLFGDADVSINNPWLFDADAAAGKRQEELKEMFCLPYFPKYLQYVAALPTHKIEVWQLSGPSQTTGFQFGGRMVAGKTVEID